MTTASQSLTPAVHRALGERRYIPHGVPRGVPAGRVLVHNHVRHRPGTHVGVRGFRAWTQPVGYGTPIILCACGWAPLAGPHYRMDLERPRTCPICGAPESDVISDGCPAAEDLDEGEHDCLALRLEEARRP